MTELEVTNCAACNQDHDSVTLKDMDHFDCPETGRRVEVLYAEESEPEPEPEPERHLELYKG